MAKESKKQVQTIPDHQSLKEMNERSRLIRILDEALRITELARDGDEETTETAPITSSFPQRTSSNRESRMFHVQPRLIPDGQYTASRNIARDVDTGMNLIDLIDLVLLYPQQYQNMSQSTKDLWLPQRQRRFHTSCTDWHQNIKPDPKKIRVPAQYIWEWGEGLNFCLAGLYHRGPHISIWTNVRTWHRSYNEKTKGIREHGYKYSTIVSMTL